MVSIAEHFRVYCLHEVMVSTFWSFLKGVVFFFLIYRNSLYTLEVSLVSIVFLQNTFSHPVDYLFILWTGAFCKAEDLNFNVI